MTPRALAPMLFVLMACSGQGGAGGRGSRETGGDEAGDSQAAPGTATRIESRKAAGGASACFEGAPVKLGAGGGGGACGASLHEPSLRPLALLLMIDRSGSMAEASGGGIPKWEALGWALEQFLGGQGLEGLSVGVGFFPVADSICDARGYETPDVAIGDGTRVRGQVLQAVSRTGPGGPTPTLPALEGAIRQAASWGAVHRDHAVAVVLATDGEPTECDGQTQAALEAVAAGGLKHDPPVATFAIGVLPGDLPKNGAHVLLSGIARAGGTGEALFVDSTGLVGEQLAGALMQVRQRGVACELALPTVSGELDLGQVNVQVTDDCGETSAIYMVGDASGCDPVTGGFYFATAADGSVHGIATCPATCAMFGALTKGKVEIVVGCETVTRLR